jgi:hypothetical protein
MISVWESGESGICLARLDISASLARCASGDIIIVLCKGASIFIVENKNLCQASDEASRAEVSRVETKLWSGEERDVVSSRE